MHQSRTASGPANRFGRRLLAGFTAAVSVVGMLAVATSAQAQGDTTVVQTKLVSTDPSSYTPWVKYTPSPVDGKVAAVVQAGNLMIIGGLFNTVTEFQGPIYTRTNLAAFDATTGEVSTTFAPSVNGEVNTLLLSADGQSVYVGGEFTTVNGVTKKKLVRIRISDGSVVTTFKNKPLSAGVSDLRLTGNTLWVAGKFNKSGSTVRPALVTLDATTGVLTDQSTLVFAGLHNGGTLAIKEIAATPAGDKLVVIGNFKTVNGAAREQVAVLDIAGPTATLDGWQTNYFTSTCASVFDTFMRDVAVSPDGSYVVFVTTGAFRANTSCDTITRFELATSASGLTPTWVDMTGGDTTTAVTIVGSVIYIGGHFRWVNNFVVGDRPGQGAIELTGLAALDPLNGMPYDWNPTRERGYGVYDFLATSTGLWVASDTDNVGNEFHPRIAFFPLSGGASLPSTAVGSLPGDVLSVGAGSVATDVVNKTDVSGAGVPGTTSAMTSSDTWSHARGAMLVGSTLYTAWDDRMLYASPVNGSTIGARTLVNVMAGPLNSQGQVVTCTSSGQQYCGGAFSLDTPSITGMFYDAGRIYYTLTGSSSLYYRYFIPESGYVGGQRFTATGAVSTLNPSRVRGMFLSGGLLYFADSTNGRLYSIGFSAGNVTGSVVEVNATRDWRARGLALRAAPPGNQAPTAVISASCTFLDCLLSGTDSTDSDGSVVSYDWTFGDEDSDTGATTSHTYGYDGTYTVTLTVTDNLGLTDTVTKDVTVAAVPTSNIAFRAGVSVFTTSVTPKITVPASTQAGDELLLFVTANGDTTSTPPAGWTPLGERKDGTPDLVTRVYGRAALVTDASSVVTVTLGTSQKVATTILVYSGVDTSVAPVLASAAEPGTAMAHAAPAVSVAQPASWVVSYWADKGAGTTDWTVPGSMTQRSIVLGTGSGTVSGVAGDSAGPVPSGTWPGATATATTANGKATSFSIVLASS